MELSAPFVYAFFCERALFEKDDVLSAIRIVDRVIGSVPAGQTTRVVANLTLVAVTWSSEGKVGDVVTLTVKGRKPNGQPVGPDQDFVVELNGRAGLVGSQVVVNLTVPLEEAGTHVFSIFVDGAEKTRAALVYEITPPDQR